MLSTISRAPSRFRARSRTCPGRIRTCGSRSSDYDDQDAAPEALFRPMRNSPPLTPAAAKARAAATDPAKTKGFVGCAPKGMPNIMAQPFPIEFIDKGDTIEVRIEEYDARRTIHMKPVRDVAAQPRSSEGFSTGHWEGKTLVVSTAQLTPRDFDFTGIGAPRRASSSASRRARTGVASITPSRSPILRCSPVPWSSSAPGCGAPMRR
jgi:hypothetical protein